MLARWRGHGGRRGSPSSSWEGSLQGAPHPRTDKLVIIRSEPPPPIRPLPEPRKESCVDADTCGLLGPRRVHHCGLCPDTLIDHPRDYRGPWGPTGWQATLADGPARNRTVCASRALSPSSAAAFGGARGATGDAPCSPHDGATEAHLLEFKRRDERRQGGEEEERGGGRGACGLSCAFPFQTQRTSAAHGLSF